MNKYEWVVVFHKSSEEDQVLTERQYEFFKDHREDRFVDFDEFSLVPSAVARTYRRPVQFLKEKYPCKACGSCGKNKDFSPCSVCEGSGVDIP